MQTYVISVTACFQGDRIFGVDGSEGEGDPGHRQKEMTVLDDIGAFDNPMVDSVVDTILRYCNPNPIFLFGSVASGKSRYGGDIDVPSVMESNEKLVYLGWKYSVIWTWTRPLFLLCTGEEMSFQGCL